MAGVRQAAQDVKGDSVIMMDGRVIEQDFLAVRVAERVAGRIWLYPRSIPSSAACRYLGVNEFWRLFSFPHRMLR